jgi:hypothetical protein
MSGIYLETLMKRLLSLFVFLLITAAFVAAQCGNNGNSNSGGQNNGNAGNNGPSVNVQQAPTTISWQMAQRALHEAKAYFQQEMGLNLGQLIQKYFQGICTITLVSTNPPTNNTYRVAIGGFGIVVVIDDI